jgi:transposase-like protein
MGQVLHKRARTTEEVRREIQNNEEGLTLIEAGKKFNVNPKTVHKWRKRDFVHDEAMGPKVIRSTVLSETEEQIIVTFRRLTQLPLDDVLFSLQETIPHLTRSSLHRCLKRHGCSTREKSEEQVDPKKKKFKEYPIGYFHVDIATVQTKEGKLYLFVGIDRTSKFAFAELHPDQSKKTTEGFLRNLINAVPYKINKILTDNGLQFTNHERHKKAPEHIFNIICRENNIEHRTTKVKHPWTNGQVERMNRTIKDATVKTFSYASHKELRSHLHDFLMVHNFAKRLKSLKGKTPWQFILSQWTNHPELFTINPNHFLLGLNN